MMLNYIALLTALSISGVAAYYSIYGLTAIFSGVFWPIVIMGSVLEVGKIVTTVWLHTYWTHLKWLLKSYMSLAVIVLMFITSMGIFGFLSRAHIEVTSQAGGGDLLVQQVDQNIAIEQKRIEDARKVITQMDDAVTGLLKGSGANAERDNNRTAAMTTQATKLRETQKKERDSLNASIDASNNRITELNKQKLKLNQEQLKMEAEVGPIKYIAQLIYDDSASKDMLERAVRWVIIVIVAVFDPLAVAMVLGVTMVMNKRREEQSELQAQAESAIYSEPVVVEKIVEVPVEVIREVERILEVQVPGPVEYVEKIVTQAVPIIQEKIVEVIREVEIEKLVEVPVDRVVVEYVPTEVEVIREVEKIVEVERVVEVESPQLQQERDRLFVELNTEISRADSAEQDLAEALLKLETSGETIDNTDYTTIGNLSQALEHLMQENRRKDDIIHKLQIKEEILIEEMTGIDAEEFSANAHSTLLGTETPANPVMGQLWINTQTDMLWKFNGTNWMAVDKNQNTSYTTDESWKHWVMGRIARAEVEWDDLLPAEQTALEESLKHNA